MARQASLTSFPVLVGCRKGLHEPLIVEKVKQLCSPFALSGGSGAAASAYQLMAIDMGVHGLDGLEEPLNLTQVCIS
jgi:hypothetical protein